MKKYYFQQARIGPAVQARVSLIIQNRSCFAPTHRFRLKGKKKLCVLNFS